MFFDDDLNKRKVNMGNISLTNKNDFMKKMREEEEKERNQKQKDHSMQIIKNFMNKNFTYSSNNFKDSKLIHNLTSLINLIQTKNFEKEKNEKLAILSIQKVSDELLNMLNCRTLSNNTLFELTNIVSKVLSYTNNDLIKSLLIGNEHMKYTKIFFKLIKASIYALYFNMKKDYLINENYNIFGFIYYLNYIFPANISKIIYQALAHNNSFIYILTIILRKHKLLLGEYNKEILYEFLGEISKTIIKKRKRNNNYKFNSITYKYLEELLINYIDICFSEKKESNKNNNNELILDLNDTKNNGGLKKNSKKNSRKLHLHKKSNNLNELESGDFLTQKDEYKRKLNKKKKSSKKVKFSNNNITKNTNPTVKEEKFIRSNKRLKTEFPLILINANNEKSDDILKSNYILNNFDFEQAVNYDKRPFCRIFYIYLISKENNLNIIFFNPPLELKPIRICVFIFTYACDFALNSLFYLSDNISDKYHYSGAYRELYALVNNLTISISSTLVSFLLLFFFQTLTQSSDKIKDLFQKQELLLKTDKNYKVTEHTKKEIQIKIDSILRCLKIKIICFIILEIIFMLFFFYYVTAFCQVYQSTQVSWILDCLSSYAISLVITIVLSFVCAICYIVSLKYKIKIIYKIITFIYTFS